MPVRLFVGNLPYDTTEAELRAHFSAVGPLSSAFLPVDRETGRPRGFAFVEFADQPAANAAIQRLNNQPFKGRPLSVSEARARESRPGGPPPPGGGYRGPGGADRPPRPMGGPSSGPSSGPPGGTAEGRQRNFGPDAPRKGKGKKGGPRRDEGPKGPIPVRSGGRTYALDDIEENAVEAEDNNFDDFS
ncbi:MAG: RNA recognition motif domain-containing protein, partial [Vicinamibacterales bacterium]